MVKRGPPVCRPPTLLCVLHCTQPVCHSSLSHSGFCHVRWACSEAAWPGGPGKGVCVTLNKHRGRLAASRHAGLVSSRAPVTSCWDEWPWYLHSPPSDALCVNYTVMSCGLSASSQHGGCLLPCQQRVKACVFSKHT